MQNFVFEISDDPLFEEDLLPAKGSVADFPVEGDAYALEDLLRLVHMGDDSCIDREHITFQSDEDVLIWGLSYLIETPLGRSMAFDARYEEWALEVDDFDSNTPEIDPQLRILILPRGTPSLRALSNTPHYRTQFLVNLARGLRMIWQDMNGVRARHDISVDDQILLERVRRADQDTVMLRMAWDMHESDDGRLWRHLIADDAGELATIAAGTWSQEKEGRADMNTALLSVFRAWMELDDLLVQTDIRTLSDMDVRLGRSISGVCGPNTLNINTVLSVGRLSGGESYLAPVARTLLYGDDARRITDQTVETHLRQIIEDCGPLLVKPLIFRDATLQEKIFPHHNIDIIS